MINSQGKTDGNLSDLEIKMITDFKTTTVTVLHKDNTPKLTGYMNS
jgi:hypothetical protein